MKDSQRQRRLLAAQRLVTWFQRSGTPPAAFVNRNRAELDRLLAALAPEAPVPVMRSFANLPAAVQAKVRRRASRRYSAAAAAGGLYHLTPTSFLSRCLTDTDDIKLDTLRRLRHTSSLVATSYHRSNLRDRAAFYKLVIPTPVFPLPGATADRLLEKRLAALASTIPKYRASNPPPTTFVPDLHPDDVEVQWEADGDCGYRPVSVVASREILRLRRLLTGAHFSRGTGEPTGSTISLCPLAAIPVYRAAEGDIEVFYCAFANGTTVEQSYVGRVRRLDITRRVAWDCCFALTRPNSRLAGAIRAAGKLYSAGVARVIQPAA